MKKIESNFQSKIKSLFSHPIPLLFIVAVAVFWGIAYAQNTTSLLAPKNLAQDNNGQISHVVLKWEYTFLGSEVIHIERKMSSDRDFLPIGQTLSNSYADTSVVAGTYYYRVRACLVAVNTCSEYSSTLGGVDVGASNNNTISYTTDTILPETYITKPTEGAIVSGVVDIAVHATDNIGIAKVEFYRNHNLFISVDESYPYTANLDTTKISNGTHYLVTKAYDVAGNTSSHTISIIVNNIINNITNTVESTPNTTTTPSSTTTNTPSTNTNTPTLVVPLAPSNLRLEPLPAYTSSYLSLRWTDNASNEGEFVLERKLSNATAFTLIATKGANVNYHNDNSSVVAGAHYDYRVKACLRDVGCSIYAYLADVFIPIAPTVANNNTTTSSATTTIAPTSPKTTIPKTTNSAEGLNNPGAVVSINQNLNNTDTQNTTSVNNLQSINIFTRADIAQLTKIFSGTLNNYKELPETENEDLLKKDTNNDGVSDYDSIYIYKMDPIQPSPVSDYEGKSINAGEKILLGFSPTSLELIKINPQTPEESQVQVFESYKVKEISLTANKEIFLKGQALPNSFITLYIYSTPIIVVVKTDANGEWEYTLDKELENGEHSVYTATVNNTGNILAKSSGYFFTKTAEAVTFNDLPNTQIPTSVTKPGLLEGINIYVLIAIALATFLVLIVLIGAISKNIKQQQ